MLFKASITPEVLESDDKLCEQLYIFLNEFVPVKLRYESKEEREDCVQETMLYLLDRYHKLDKQALVGINIEKFFYNRAHTFIGTTYKRKLVAYRNANKKLVEELKQTRPSDEAEELMHINLPILENIINAYGFDEPTRKMLTTLSILKLSAFGYYTADVLEETLPVEQNRFEVLKNLSYAIVDTYLVDAAKAGDEN